MFSHLPFVIMAVSILSGLAIEGISWVLVYRTPNYKRLKAELERTNKRLEAMRSSVTPASQKDKKNKKEKRLEENMSSVSRDLTATKFKTGIITGVLLLVLYQVMNRYVSGKVVAKLPFIPLTFMQRVTHYKLEGDDFTDCAATFIFVLSSVGLRSNLQKLLGTTPPRAVAQQNSFESYVEKHLNKTK